MLKITANSYTSPERFTIKSSNKFIEKHQRLHTTTHYTLGKLQCSIKKNVNRVFQNGVKNRFEL
jgi:hypothetical protein